MKISTLFPLATLFIISTSQAQNAAVSLENCNKMANTKAPFTLVLDQNADLHDSISQCAKAAKLKGAQISAIGQVHDVSMAYFTPNPKDVPTTTTFPGYYELASLNGNVSHAGDRYYTHVHGVLADKEFHGIAGHIDKAKVGLTVEVSIVPLDKPLLRTVDDKTGFGPIVTDK